MASSGPRLRPTRFAHLEGQTNICYSEDGRIITGGLDGDVRIFKDLDDDDCITHTLAEEVHCIAFKNDSILAGTNLNMVQAFTLDEGKPNGIINRVTAFPTHINLSKDKNIIAVASSDMTIKVHDSSNYKDILFSGHESAVLSVALDPQGDYLASSACDGTVRIWNFRTQTVVRVFNVFEKSNDFPLSTTLCRISWTLDGQHLLVPADTEIKVYNRNTWKVEFSLTHTSITKTASVTCVSPCGKYVALGCRDGRIAVWDLEKRLCIASEAPNKSNAITGLAWHPSGKEEIAFVNLAGEFGTLVDFLQSPMKEASSGETKTISGTNGVEDSVNPEGFLSDEDENEISIAKIKSQLGFADDEEGTFLGLPKPEVMDQELTSIPSRTATPLPTLVAPKLPEAQKPFQPGMSPEDLNDRYMLWNSTGIVRQCQTEDESSIEVEFHDSSVHHSLHLNNHAGYSMAALNSQALVLASESQDDQLSQLSVNHFSAWDASKEWQADMPEGEDILAVCIGLDWLAVATDLRNLRVFTTAGVQRDVIALPGPVVCLAGFEKNIVVVFHNGMGVLGEQSLAILALNLSGRNHLIPSPEPLPLSPKSFLAWTGFTDEGTPLIMDSAGVIRLFNQSMGHTWAPILNTKMHAKGKSDHYFLLGASEMQAEIRCILCKGARFPPVVPRPHVSLLSFKIPLTGAESEKSALEERVSRTKIQSWTVDRLSRNGFDMDMAREEVQRNLKEAMVKLFALAVRSDREARAVDVCELMPDPEMVQVAIKYASKMHRIALAERLNDVVQKKSEEEAIRQSHRDEVHHLPGISLDYRNGLDYSEMDSDVRSVTLSETVDETQEIESLPCSQDSTSLSASQNISENLSFGDHTRSTTTPRNPFKKSVSTTGPKGLQMLDTVRVTQKKAESSILRPVFKGVKSKKANPLESTKETGKENKSLNSEPKEKEGAVHSIAAKPASVVRKPSALKLWMEDNREMIETKFPGSTETELLVKSAQLFKDIDDEVKQVVYYVLVINGLRKESEYQDERKEQTNIETQETRLKYKERATSFQNPPPVVEKTDEATPKSDSSAKRKSETQSVTDQKAEKKSRIGSKLAGFAFNKNS